MAKYYASELIKTASNEIGYLEKKSNSQLSSKTANAGSGNYTKYANDFDNKYKKFYNGAKNGYPWCDVFVDWCFVKAFGEKAARALLCQPEKSCGAGCGFSMDYYKSKGQFYKTAPKIGDQIFFFNSSKTDIAHTGLVVEVDKNVVYTIEGNTSGTSNVVANGGVCRKKYYLTNDRIAGYGRPKYDTEQATKIATTTALKNPYKEPILNVKYGSQGNGVRWIQWWLNEKGFNCGNVDGDFGAKTKAAVLTFQKKQKIEIDGIVGKITRARLKA